MKPSSSSVSNGMNTPKKSTRKTHSINAVNKDDISPEKKRFAKVIDERSDKPSFNGKEVFVPRAINAVVNFESKQEVNGSKETETFGLSSMRLFAGYKHKADVLKFVETNYMIPDDIENSIYYGAKSGSCYGDKVITAYMNGKLNLLKNCIDEKMCFECGETGHFPTYCPKGF